MVTLAFVMLVITIFAVLLGMEGNRGEHAAALQRPPGLWTWLTTGNWSAKLGAGLIILGVGALLRYLLIHIELPPVLKLGAGVGISLLLAAAALALRQQPARRGLRLALAGAAGGVAYLTAYSAYALFGYVADSTAFSLLVLVAVMVGVIAVREHALSMAVLAMLGAFIAPYFALAEAGPLALNGYYLLLSLLVLAMVLLRGWRPLIHLSFLFTLAATLFFAWSRNYYAPQYFGMMLPLLLALSAVHLAMPLLEGHDSHCATPHLPAAWLQRFDLGYFYALPLAALALAFKLAPDAANAALAIALLAAVWGLGALLARQLGRSWPRYLWLAVLMLLLACAIQFRSLPWSLLGVLLASAAYLLAPRIGIAAAQQDWLALGILVLAVLHMVENAFGLRGAEAWRDYGEKFLLSSTLLGVAWAGRQRGSKGFTVLIGWTGGIWGALALLRLLLDLHLGNWPLVLFVAALAASAALYLLADKVRLPGAAAWLAGALLVSGMQAAQDSTLAWAVAGGVLALAALWALLQMALRHGEQAIASVVLLVLPLALWPWARVAGQQLGWQGEYFGASMLMAGLLLSAWLARRQLPPASTWQQNLAPVAFHVVAAIAALVLLLHIERNAWAVVFELLALAYLALRTRWSSQDAPESTSARHYLLISVLVLALWVQAQALRLWGPPGLSLTALDLRLFPAPVLLSLLWATLGALLAIGGHRLQERVVWSAGAMLLVLSAVKIVLFDFGSLGGLQNIIAIIAAGCMFLAVSWWAPFPPARKELKAQQAAPQEMATPTAGSRPSLSASAAPLQRATAVTATPRPAAAVRPDGAVGTGPDQSWRSAQGKNAPDEMAGIVRHPRTQRPQDQPASSSRGLLPWIGLAVVALLLWSGYQQMMQSSRYAAAQAAREQQARIGQREQAEGDVAARAAATAKEAVRAAELSAATAAGKSAEAQGTAEAAASRSAPAIASKNAAASAAALETICTQFARQLPPDYVLLAGGAYRGRGGSGQFNVTLDQPGDKPVVLALGAYEASQWRIAVRPGTRLAGVILSGYHAQRVDAINTDAPLLHLSQDTGSPCGYFYLSGSDTGTVAHVQRTLQQITGRDASRYLLAQEGELVFSGRPALEISR